MRILGRDLTIGSTFYDERGKTFRTISGFEGGRTASGNRIALAGAWQISIADTREYVIRFDAPLSVEERSNRGRTQIAITDHEIDDLQNVCSPAPAELDAMLGRVMEATKARLPERERAGLDGDAA